jgi:hypothetical protein
MKQEINFWDRLQAKVITPYFDNRMWDMVSNSPSIFAEKFETNSENLNFYYPNLDIEKLTKGGYSFVLDNFSSYRFKGENVWLDPDFGWVIPSHLKIFKYSFPYAEDPWDHMKRRPRTLKYLRKNYNMRTIELGASFRFGWQNYYHFFMDGLTQLRALDLFDPEGTIPIIVPEYFNNNRFSRDFFCQIFSGKREVIIHSSKEYLYVKKLFLFKEDILSNSLDAVIDQIRPSKKVSNQNKIFITRNSFSGRTIRNMEEVMPVLKDFGFEIVDCNEMGLLEQVELFSSASHVAGIHGAGLVNTIFKKGGALKVLEIAPDHDFQPEHYKNICKKFDFEHRMIFGENLDNQGNFLLNPVELSKLLKDF